jgi:hypothetical protein
VAGDPEAAAGSARRCVIAYATGVSTDQSWKAEGSPQWTALRNVKLFATASLAPNDTAAQREVNSYASMGFLQGGVELEAPRLAKPSGYPHVLISYAYDKDHSFFEKKLGYDPPDWLGDSGAFTAWTVGQEVDLEGLIAWCQWHVARKPSFVTINLDVIPGKPGGNTAPTKREQARAIAESIENADAMRAAGLKVMEVFHVFEPLKHLELLIERRQPGEILGLGGMVGRSTALKTQFCQGVFHRLKEVSGGTFQDFVPTHGLGLSVRSRITADYPFWSVDSSSWIAPAMYGKAVTRGGVTKGNDPRTKNRSVRALYLTRTLEGWLRRERALTQMWADRGLTFAD